MKHEWGEERESRPLGWWLADGPWFPLHPPQYVACQNCGVSNRMAEHMGWFDCAAVPADSAVRP